MCYDFRRRFFTKHVFILVDEGIGELLVQKTMLSMNAYREMDKQMECTQRGDKTLSRVSDGLPLVGCQTKCRLATVKLRQIAPGA